MKIVAPKRGILTVAASLLISVSFLPAALAQEGMITGLHRYFPEKTAFFMEVSPTPAMNERIHRAMDKQLPGRKVEPGEPEAFPMGRFLDEYHSPEWAFGMWMDLKETPVRPSSPPKDHRKTTTLKTGCVVLGVLPLKEGITQQTFAEALLHHMPEDQASDHWLREGDLMILKPKETSDPILVLNQDHLFITNSLSHGLKAASQAQSGKSFLDDPLYTAALEKLQGDRQGTMLLASQKLFSAPIFQELTLPGALGRSSMSQHYGQFQHIVKEMALAFPVSVASIHMETDRLLTLETITMAQWDQMNDALLREDLKTFLSAQTPMSELTSRLPENSAVFSVIAGLGAYYDLLMHQLNLTTAPDGLQHFEAMLSMFDVNLRSNLVSLTDKHLAYSLIWNREPDFLVFLNRTPQTQQTVDKVVSLVPNLREASMEDRVIANQWVAKTFSLPKVPFKPALMPLEPDYFVLGTVGGVESMGAVAQRRVSALREHPLFTELARGLGEQTMAFMFVNVPKTIEYISHISMPKRVPSLLQPAEPKEQGHSEANIRLVESTTEEAPPKKPTALARTLRFLEGVVANSAYDDESIIRGSLRFKLAPPPGATE